MFNQHILNSTSLTVITFTNVCFVNCQCSVHYAKHHNKRHIFKTFHTNALCQWGCMMTPKHCPHKGTALRWIDVFFAVGLNKILNKQLIYRRFETPLHSYSANNTDSNVDHYRASSLDGQTTAAEAAAEQTRFHSVNNLWAFDEFAHIDNWIVYPYSIIVLRYHWLVYFDLILFYFLVFYLKHYSYQYYSYCEFYIVFTIISNVLLPVCFMYHYFVPLFIFTYVYLFIYLFIESRGLATFWCWCYLFYNVPTVNKIFLLLLVDITGPWSPVGFPHKWAIIRRFVVFDVSPNKLLNNRRVTHDFKSRTVRAQFMVV